MAEATSKVLVPGSIMALKEIAQDPSAISPKIVVKVDPDARSGGSLEAIELPEHHVIEVELEDGQLLYFDAERLMSLADQGQPGRGSDGVRALPSELPLGAASRGGGLGIHVFRFFFGKDLAEATAFKAAEAIEGLLEISNADSLIRVASDGTFAPADQSLPAGKRMLVFLHGTASSTRGSFGALIPDPAAEADTEPFSQDARGYWSRLTKSFADDDGSNIFAFEHQTLTRSPIENAIALLEALPKHAELTLLSHSRGGLVGELLALAQRSGDGALIDDLDRNLFRMALGEGTELYDAQLADLDRLEHLLRAKRPKIVGFVRTACPTKGTILASDRLDDYLTVFLNLLLAVPGPQRVFFAVVRDFIKSIVAQKDSVENFPGLAAMVPEAPIIRMLNRIDRTTSAPLAVVSGDIQASGFLSRLTTIALDLFFGEKHDLVVHTRSMLAHGNRSGEVAHFFDRGAEVSHFSYFRNSATAGLVTDLLTGVDTSQHVLRRDVRIPLEPSAARSQQARSNSAPTVFLLPGIMGSTLSRGDRKIWFNPLKMAGGGIRNLGSEDGTPIPGVTPSGTLQKYYGGLERHLQESHHVEVFPYDWRLSIAREADRLARRVSQALERSDRPVRIVAHSMGGLVVRLMMARHPKLFDDLKARDGFRFVMLGTPNRGSAAIVWSLLGQDKMIRSLALLDMQHSTGEVVERIISMPGILELLPQGRSGTFFSAKHWGTLSSGAPDGWEPPASQALNDARLTVKRLAHNPADAKFMCCVAGCAKLTPTDVKPNPVRLLSTSHGDGRVTWRSGQLSGVPMWFAEDTVHGDLPRNKDLFEPIRQLLETGNTSELPRTPPVARSEQTIETHLAGASADRGLFPDANDMEALIMGADPDKEFSLSDETSSRCCVRLIHGDLRRQRGTIVVGHYRNARLLGAERALDWVLNGQLAQARALDLYPGKLRESEIFQRESDNTGPEGALVVGLGDHGSLSKQGLVGTLMQAFIRYALKIAGTEKPGLSLSTLIVGHRDSVLTIADCVEAIVEAMEKANARLPKKSRFSELNILELYEDYALEAGDALRRLSENHAGPLTLDLQWEIERGVAGRQRNGFRRGTDEEAIISIEVKDNAPDVLHFRGLNGGALVSDEKLAVNTARIDRYIAAATERVRANPVTGKVLFAWMIPPALKAHVSDTRDLTLVLDRRAAAYPWELLQDNWSNSGKPIAITSKLIRQLVEKPRADKPVLATQNRALIVGDPVTHLARLPGAKAEAEDVVGQFESIGWSVLQGQGGESAANAAGELDVLLGEGAHADLIAEAISLRENRILHFAGHGVAGADKGLVVGQDTYIGPEVIRSLRHPPEFVFLNCCDVGALEQDASEEAKERRIEAKAGMAADLATEFMKAGSKAVIAAGWEVHDSDAKQFSAQFYKAFLNGSSFGDAVQTARRVVYETANGRSRDTWGAYQCYGDAQYRLFGIRDGSANPTDVRLNGANQAATELLGMVYDVRLSRTEAGLRRVARRFDCICEVMDRSPSWKKSARFWEAHGRLAAELGRRDQAIESLETAMGCDARELTVDASELLLKLRVRSVNEDGFVAASENDKDTMDAVVEREQVQLESLIGFLKNQIALYESSATPSRLSRLGDSYLRLAATHAKSRRIKTFKDNLHQAMRCFQQAETKAGQVSEPDRLHAGIRVVLARYMLALEDGKGLEPHQIRVLRKTAEELTQNQTSLPTFDNLRLIAEAQVFAALTDQQSLSPDTIRAIFIDLFEAGASPAQRFETVSDLKTVARLLSRKNPIASDVLTVAISEIEDSNISVV